MADDIINAKIVFDDSSLKQSMNIGGGKGGSGGGGISGAISKTAFAQDSPVWGDIMAGVGGMVLALNALVDIVKWGFGKIVAASPHLQATMDLLTKTVKVTLRPIGDVISSLFRPFLIGWLRVVLPVYKAWRQWFGEGGGLEARIEISEGFSEIWEGIKNWDFTQVMDGVKQVWDGFKDLFKSFGSEVLGPQVDAFYDWWAERQEQFNTSGIFDTLWEMFKSAASGVMTFIWEQTFKPAWDKFIEYLKGTTWGNALVNFSETLWGLWTDFGTKLESYSWAGPLAPFFAAIATGWDGIVEPMVSSLVDKLSEKLPGFASAVEYLFGDDEGEDGGGFFGSIWEGAKGLMNWLTETFGPYWDELFIFMTGGMVGLVTYMNTDMSKSLQEMNKVGEKEVGSDKTGLVSKFNATSESMIESQNQTTNLISRLNDIPRNITTTHTIRTVRVSSGD